TAPAPPPAGPTFVSATPSQGTATQAGGTVTADLGTIANGGNATITIVVTVNSDVANNTTLTNSGTASIPAATGVVDPNSANNTGTTTTLVETSADLVVTKTDTPDPVNAGQTITYTLTVANTGPSDAQNVVLSDTPPAHTTFANFISISQGSAVFAGGPVTATFGTITAGGNATLVFVVTVNADTPNGTTITNAATAVSTTADPNSANNTGTS